jgi:hypothetical protein
MSEDTQNGFDQILYDKLTLVKKEIGDFQSKEYIYEGNLGRYKLRIGQSITDNTKVFYIYCNNKMFVNLYPTKRKNVLVGREEDSDRYYIFRFEGKTLNIWKRRYDI